MRTRLNTRLAGRTGRSDQIPGQARDPAVHLTRPRWVGRSGERIRALAGGLEHGQDRGAHCAQGRKALRRTSENLSEYGKKERMKFGIVLQASGVCTAK